MDITKALLVRSLRDLPNNHSLSQSQQEMEATDIQEEDIRISINIPYIEGTRDKQRRIPRSHKISSTFSFEST